MRSDQMATSHFFLSVLKVYNNLPVANQRSVWNKQVCYRKYCHIPADRGYTLSNGRLHASAGVLLRNRQRSCKPFRNTALTPQLGRNLPNSCRTHTLQDRKLMVSVGQSNGQTPSRYRADNRCPSPTQGPGQRYSLLPLWQPRY